MRICSSGLSVFVALFFLSCEQQSVTPAVSSGTSDPFQWQSSSLQAQQVDSVLIDSALAKFSADQQMFGFVLIRNGLLVTEYYHPLLKPYNECELRSATKSYVSALVGIALAQGLIDSLDQPMISFFPEFNSPALDPRTRSITVRHLLTMRAGIDYSDGDPLHIPYTQSDHWVQKTIHLPLKYSPGEKFYYSSVQTHLLSAIIAKQSGMSTRDFGKKYLFEPGRIQIGHWDQDPQGIYFGGSGLSMTPRAMARFGEIIRQHGKAELSTVIPEEWIHRSIKPNNLLNSIWGEFTSLNYGFSWWMNGSGPDSIFFAAGSGGQFIIIAPQKNAVIVTTANPNLSQSVIDRQEERIIQIITRYVLPALR